MTEAEDPSQSQTSVASFTVTAEHALDLVAADRALIVDATVQLPRPRYDGDYRIESGRDLREGERIAGSAFADLTDELSDPNAGFHFGRPTRDQVDRFLFGVGARPGTTVIAYDTGGLIWASRLVWILRGFGVPAAVLDGGLPAWKHAGGQVLSGSGPVREDRAAGAPERIRSDEAGVELSEASLRMFWRDRSAVEDILEGAGGGEQLVCALGAAEFSGAAPTRYSRRGHIPGSLNVPARSLLDERGRLLEPDTVRQLLPDGLDPSRPVVVYCGGGVSASLAAIQLRRAGVRRVSVYDGSLEEWSADETLPLEREGR